ncbi:MAG: hypothetical protein AB1426_06820 [Bacillota bacterium]
MSPDQLNALAARILEQLGQEGGGGKDDGPGQRIVLTPSQVLLLAAILGGVVDVEAVQVFSDQRVRIWLTGTLRRRTMIDKFLDSIGGMRFDEVIRAFLGHFG